MLAHNHARQGLGTLFTSIAFLATIAVLLPSVALAPPPGGGGDPTGVIYFHRDIPYYGTELWYMNADGSGKAALLAGVDGEPSWDVHGGARWFLQFQEVAGKLQLFAVSEDLTLAQLTDEPEILDSTPRWVNAGGADGMVSWIAQGGIYSVPVVYDAQTSAFTGAGSTVLLVPGDDIASHDWAPTGTSLVYRSAGGDRGDGLWVVNDVSDPDHTTTPLTADRYDPVWSPNPDVWKIAHKSASTYPAYSIFTINPDGTDQEAVLEITPLTTLVGPRWSPTGSHLTYERRENELLGARDVYIAKANGRKKKNLTGDIDDAARPVAWREGAGASSYCGDGNHDPGEDACNCPEDVPGDPPPEVCDDGLDNDCDGLVDCDDPDCGGAVDEFGDPICPFQMCTVEGDGWATMDGGCKDLQTGLVWSLRTSNYTWSPAMQYAENLGEGGHLDWRLPTKAELETAAQHLAAEHLPGTYKSWSSTEQGGRKAWTVDLADGSSEAIRKNFLSGFFCVRQSAPQ